MVPATLEAPLVAPHAERMRRASLFEPWRGSEDHALSVASTCQWPVGRRLERHRVIWETVITFGRWCTWCLTGRIGPADWIAAAGRAAM